MSRSAWTTRPASRYCTTPGIRWKNGFFASSSGIEAAMDQLLSNIARKKTELDELRPLSQDALRHLQRHFDVELTYTSNAIEGNTLTLRETAEVIEHGLTVGGKRLRDHLEAVDRSNEASIVGNIRRTDALWPGSSRRKSKSSP